MEKFYTPLLAVVAVIIGWGLNELSALIRNNQSDRSTIGRVLFYLADMRHDLFAMTGVIDLLAVMFPINENDEIAFKTTLERMLPKSDDIHKQFEDVITVLADRQPHLAFRLSKKDRISDIITLIRNSVDSSAESIRVYTQVEKAIMTKAFDNMDSIILELASMHGIRTRWKFGKLVKYWNDPDETKKEIEGLFQEIFGGTLEALMQEKK